MVEEKVLEILEDLCPGEGLGSREDLADSRVLDSLAIVALVAEIEEEFGIAIPTVDIAADNFNSVSSISALVSHLVEDQIGS